MTARVRPESRSAQSIVYLGTVLLVRRLPAAWDGNSGVPDSRETEICRLLISTALV